MSRVPIAAVMLLGVGMVISSFASATAQKRSFNGRIQSQQLIRRIDQLERRVAALENSLPLEKKVPSTPTVDWARQHVATMQARYEFSQKMYGKGYISEAELESDRYELERARKTLELAEASRDELPTEPIALDIEILDAEHHLAMATRQLELARKFAAHGFTGRSGVDQHQLAVDEAEAQLERVRQAKRHNTP